MILDAVTVRNLELLEPLFAGESKESTLIHVLDQTCTGMGGRLLRHRLLRPSLEIGEIEARLDAVEESFAGHHCAIGDSQAAGEHSRSGTAAREADSGDGRTARIISAGAVLGNHSAAQRAVRCFSIGARLRGLRPSWTKSPKVRDRILSAIAEEPPANLADGGTIRSGYHAELDELRDISRNSRQYIAQIETRERGSHAESSR